MPDSCAKALAPTMALLRWTGWPVSSVSRREVVDAPRVDARVDTEIRRAHLQRHHDFFQRRIAGAFADAVDRALHLARAGADRGEAVGTARPRSSWQWLEKITLSAPCTWRAGR
jgi:hypothetical protein